jgi:hypothetical protein
MLTESEPLQLAVIADEQDTALRQFANEHVEPEDDDGVIIDELLQVSFTASRPE